ncbi:LysR substrate-binding domain-containing protein [Enterovirga sp.]|uniref:LysR substrate-binding domain-containing protein n=1 Tax=Enterovirga sp. TaxID=2026350 RepID=UPI002D0D9121|nr:LysR substrate-binding domain-containing protein [Enterovirga sp.]HMO28354.1 LysR substrate-binding domain-containing protein [Enterovirga sp.]
MVDLSGLRAFHAVALAESFTRAARARGVSQPTLSAQVRTLEEAHGIRLFDRVGRTVRLTALGQSLFVITTRLMAAEDEAADFLAGTKALTRGHLRIAADSARHVMGVLARFRASHPGLTFALTMGNSTGVLDQVAAYEADIAVTAKQTSDPRLHSLRLRTDRLVAFARADHPLARRRTIPIEAMAGQDLVLRERGSVTREIFETRLAEAGVRAGSLLEVQSREAVQEAVAAGLGLGIVFGSEFQSGETLRRIAVTGADLSVAEYAVCLEERRRIPLVRAFLAALSASPPAPGA